MKINWTPEQLKVIESRDRNLLVSAAAGSGKTAVLVERIVQKITEGENPLDIDQLLVMTFTKAAASEMRERVLAAVGKKLMETPEDEHLQLQEVLIPHAQITTIDSFCLSLVREHYNSLDIDPSFTIGDEGEIILLKDDVMRQLIEDYYAAGDSRFGQFVETYASGKADKGIEDYIYQVYTFSQSTPRPRQWIAKCREELESDTVERLEETPWIQFLMRDVHLQVGELGVQIKEALNVCDMEDGPAPYRAALIHDLEMLEAVENTGDYQEFNRILKSASFDRLASIRGKDVDPEKKEYVTGCRDRVKKAVGKLKERYCFESVEEVLHDISGTREAVLMLLDLAENFADRYQAAKKDKNIVDFNDMEHYALDVLSGEDGGEDEFTPVADELSLQYEEILVDEYQDSNDVQEALIRCISRERFGQPNVFMVGDVKQSIYKFRLARPELFLQKYQTYGEEDGKYQKIELHQNFRSREQVLTGVNEIFYRIMTKNLGNIQYTKETALHPGAEFEPGDGRVAEIPELMMVNTSGDLLKDLDEDVADFTSRELEAKMIAGKIRELTDPVSGLKIWDKKTGKYRISRPGDMVILLRSVSGWTESFINILMNEGILAYAESRQGYFDTLEVETVLSLLSVIDNPIQDIALAAVFKSPVVGLTDEELAYLMAAYKKSAKKGQDRGLYGAFCHYLEGDGPANSDKSQVLYDKLEKFLRMLEQFRNQSAYLTIHELIYKVYEDTGYYDYACAMPAGAARRANLDMLVEKAAAFEKSSYKGLFHFIRYIEKLKKFDQDFGEASLAGEDENTVRIMSIHKSKGLEFPVVFLAGMGKKFNKRDAYGRILIDPELGVGTDYLDLERRVKTTTLKKNVLKRKVEIDALGEELRVLYVAMTRAKEKLIMTGTDRYLEKKIERFAHIPLADGQIPFTVLSTADSYLDWVLMSLLGRDGENCPVRILEITIQELVGKEIERQTQKIVSKDEFLNFDTDRVYDEKYADMLKTVMDFQYPYQEDVRLHAKISVSELKKQGQTIDSEESAHLATIPSFMKAEQGNEGGAVRGTAYHRVLELLDFSGIHSQAEAESAIMKLQELKKIASESCDLVDAGEIWKFLSSPLGKRMSQAQAEGRLYKERQFVIGIPACEMGISGSDELVLIQGIIDAYMEEDGKLIVVDYKTDRVAPGQEYVLTEHYGKQLEYYQRALEQITGKEVAQRWIYSITLQEELLV